MRAKDGGIVARVASEAAGAEAGAEAVGAAAALIAAEDEVEAVARGWAMVICRAGW